MLCASLYFQIRVDEFSGMVYNAVACAGCVLWLNGMSFGSNEDSIRSSVNASVLKEVELEWDAI